MSDQRNNGPAKSEREHSLPPSTGSASRVCVGRRDRIMRQYRLVGQFVCWSGDSLDICSECGMDIYDPAFGLFHPETCKESLQVAQNDQAHT